MMTIALIIWLKFKRTVSC